MKDLRDTFLWIENRKLLTVEETGIKGLRLLGHDTCKNARGSNKFHYHKDAMEITYIVQGMRTYSVKEEDFFAAGGYAYITFPNEPHNVGNQSHGIGNYFWMQIAFEGSDGFMGLTAPWDQLLYQRLLELKSRKVRIDKHFSKTLECCIHKFVQPDPESKSEAHLLFLSFLNELLKAGNQGEVPWSEDITKIIHHIKAHLYEDIQFEDLSDISGLSVSGLKHKFTDQVGIPPMQYVNYLKIEEAKRLIETGEKFSDIAVKLGFASKSHFSAVFKKLLTITPSDYKRRMKEARMLLMQEP